MVAYELRSVLTITKKRLSQQFHIFFSYLAYNLNIKKRSE